MVKIASHHRNGDFAKDDFFYPTQPWPKDCTVQWGTDASFSDTPEDYRSAFVEAFPKGGGLIRGEADTLEEAERKAYQRYVTEAGCQHEWSRRGYQNGLGTCRCCEARKRVFHPIVTLGAYKEPMHESELEGIASGFLRPTPRQGREPDPGSRRYRRRQELRARYWGLELPETPSEPPSDAQFIGEAPDPYQEACTDAVIEWLETRVAPEEIDREQGGRYWIVYRRVTQERDLREQRRQRFGPGVA